ncbi:alpha/beta fold hydrolase [Saccharomonospora sp. CUA-673]|uniref:alpha/beta fold hydrolase n=1 Tax=Saccharomonospora sp. CUA-673 TaxID=1904969 RepID=UPI00096A9865
MPNRRRSDEWADRAESPVLRTVRSRSRRPVAAVLVLHGGAEHGLDPVPPWRAAYLRMVPFARALVSTYGRLGVDVHLLRNRVRGWNEPERQPVADARWALERIREVTPDVPLVLVGHSMGGRVALRVADATASPGCARSRPGHRRANPSSRCAGARFSSPTAPTTCGPGRRRRWPTPPGPSRSRRDWPGSSSRGSGTRCCADPRCGAGSWSTSPPGP